MEQFKIFNDDRKNAIYEIQHYLRFLSKHNNNISTVTPDGIFGPETEKSVSEFQREYSIPVNGEVDNNTWNMLRDAYFDKKEDKVPPNPIFVFPIDIIEMKAGDDYSEIIILQAILRKLADRYENVSKPNVSGVFDLDTELSIKQLQNIFGLENNGRVDRKTWNRLADLYSIFTYND